MIRTSDKKRTSSSLLAVITAAVIPFINIVDAYAVEHQPLEEIRQTAREFATSQYVDPRTSGTVETKVEVGYLDKRLKLRKCDTPLNAELLSQQSQNTNFTVTVKCHGDKPWTVYVPVKVLSYVSVKVATRPLARGISVQESDISTEKREVSRLRSGYFVSAENLIGRIPKRSLPKGVVISPNDLTSHKVIRRGGKVSILAKFHGVAVRMPGKALSDGAQGEMIKVENLSSKRVIDAIAIKPGIVEVPM